MAKGKYGASKRSVLDKKKADIESKIGSNSRPGYLKIETGNNYFKIAPAHNSEKHAFFELKSTCWLQYMVDKRDDNGKVIEGEQELKKRPVFNARVHGNVDFDLIEKYVEMYKEMVEEELKDSGLSAGEKKKLKDKKMDLIYKGTSPSNIRENLNLKFSNINVIYAWKMTKKKEGDKVIGYNFGEFGRLELKRSMVDDLEKLNFDEDGEPMEFDAFSGVEDSHIMVVKKSGTGLDTKYETTKGRSITIPDKVLEDNLDNVDSLNRILVNSFSKSDMLAQIAGLENFDKVTKTGLFKTPAFQNVVEDFIMQFSFDSEESEETENNKSTVKEYKAEETEEDFDDDSEFDSEEESGDKFDNMSRKELAAYYKANKQNFDIKLLKSDSDDTIREKLRTEEARLSQLDNSNDDLEEEFEEETQEVDDLPWDTE